MYLPRTLISHLYQHLVRTHHPLSPPVLVFVALEPDALCACRILTALFKRDYIAHKIQPISGYGDLEKAGQSMVHPMRLQDGGTGGVVVCLGVGGLVDVSNVLGLDADEDGVDPSGGVAVWLIDARRPWNLGNVFGGDPLEVLQEERGGTEVINGQLQTSYRPGKGGIIVYDDGDIEHELTNEREAYCELSKMPELDKYGSDSGDSGEESDVIESIEGGPGSRKRKSWSGRDEEDEESQDEEFQRRRRRRTDSSESPSLSPSRRTLDSRENNQGSSDVSPPGSPTVQPTQLQAERQPSIRQLRRRLRRKRRKFTKVLENYYALGASYSEPISSILYSLAEDLGREDNDLLWQAIVGVSSLELYGRSMTGVGISTALDSGGSAGWGGQRGEQIRQVLRDEVRRLNPPEPNDVSRENARGETSGVIPTTARSPTDNSIRLSPEPRFLLIRHWSLYDSMLHSPYLASRLHLWSDAGRKRLHKLLAKMGVSLSQCKQNYTHMDMNLKRDLRKSLLTYAPMYGLDGLVPPAAGAGRGKEGWGFVRSWGWKACLSAVDVGVLVGAILEVGKSGVTIGEPNKFWDRGKKEKIELADEDGRMEGEEWVRRFWEAYDALENIEALKHALPIAQHLHRAILRTGTSLIEKRQIRHLRAFRMAVVKEGPDVALFTHPAALTKLALWVGEAIAEQEREQRGKIGKSGRATPLVMASLNEARGVYVVVGTGGGGGVIDFAARAERKVKLEAKANARKAKQAEREKKRAEREARRDENGEDEESEEEEGDDDDDDDSDDSEDDDDVAGKGLGRNRFGNAFQEVVDETNARVKIDSFEHCVVEVKKEDLSGFLESLSMKTVVG
ncbi:DNA replication initiation factor cdc45 [Lecanora helva]